MMTKTISGSRIIQMPGRRGTEEGDQSDRTSGCSWTGICPKALKAPKGRTLRNGLSTSGAILLAVLFTAARPVIALGGGGGAEVRLSHSAPPPVSEVGVASWYGHPYHGRQAASGEIYNMHRLTAAHRTLPLGTRVRVHNLENARWVDVNITDRGPFVAGRVIDVSRAAAHILGMQDSGMARVRLEVLPVSTRLVKSD